MFDNGITYFNYISKKCGLHTAILTARLYIELRKNSSEPNEIQFCNELYQAMNDFNAVQEH